jgi:hypothetical protein
MLVRRCEKRSDEASQLLSLLGDMDCFAPLAMTNPRMHALGMTVLVGLGLWQKPRRVV